MHDPAKPNRRNTHQCDVPTGRRRRHVQRRLLYRAAAVERPRKCAHRSAHHQILVDLAIVERMLRRPDQRLEAGRRAGRPHRIDVGVAQQRLHVRLVAAADANFALVGEQRLVRRIVDEAIEEGVLFARDMKRESERYEMMPFTAHRMRCVVGKCSASARILYSCMLS